MSDLKLKAETNHKLEVYNSNMDLQMFAGSSASETFFRSNKKITLDYRVAFALAIGTTGTIPRIVKMAFGTAGEVDSQNNPLPPSDNGPLNNVVLIKDITSVTYPVPTTVCFEACIETKDDLTASINEVALLDENNNTVAKIRLLTSKGIDAESGLIFRWSIEF